MKILTRKQDILRKNTALMEFNSSFSNHQKTLNKKDLHLCTLNNLESFPPVLKPMCSVFLSIKKTSHF